MLRKIVLFSTILSFCILEGKSKFLLLMGPSGVGKSTIIRHLKEMDNRFEYVTPFTTRALREGEADKIHVELQEIKNLENAGKLLTVNQIYGIYYATPKYLIDESLECDCFPVLDWPVDKIQIMQNNYVDCLFRVYIEPENRDILKEQLSNDSRDKDGKRLSAGLEELEKLDAGDFENCYDMRIINRSGDSKKITEEIYRQFILAL